MNRCAIGGLLAVLVCASWALADLATDRKSEEGQQIIPFTIKSYTDKFKGNKRAVAIVSGKGRTCLGLYVFDEHGNCVAKDDLTTPQTSDDLAAEWVPGITSQYNVEIYNAGNDVNIYRLALR